MTAVRALCADEAFDPAWWDPDSTEHTVAAQVCRQCPLLASCRQDARERRLSGMYGAVLHTDGVPERATHPVPQRGRSFEDTADPRAAAVKAGSLFPDSVRAVAGRRAVLLAEMPSYGGRSA